MKLEVKIKDYLKNELLLTEKDINEDKIIFSTNYRDSIDFMKLIVFIEKKLKLKIPKSKIGFKSFDRYSKILSTILINK